MLDDIHLPGIPAVDHKLPLELHRVLAPMREILLVLSDPNNAVVHHALTNYGLLPQDDPAPQELDTTQPPSPRNLTVAGALATMILEWEPGSTQNIAHTEIWRANANDISQAVLIGTSAGNLFPDPIGAGATRFYWVRHVSVIGTPGLFNAQLGTQGTTGTNAKYLIDVLAANPPDASYNRLLYTLEEDTTINGTLIPAGVYMNAAYIANGSILNAMIGTAAIDEAKIARAAIASAHIQELSVLDSHIRNITADKIRTGRLAADVEITVGQTPGGLPALELRGSGDIISNGTNGDFARMHSGNFEVHKNVPNVGVVPYKALSRVEVGVAVNDTVVTLPGYFRSEPKIIVSPFNIGLYKTAFANQDQTLNCQALNIKETAPGSMVWTFKPVATLTLASNTGSTILNHSTSSNTNGVVYSSNYTTPANCKSITPSVHLNSNRGNGASQYYYRSVRWRVEYLSGSTWVAGPWTTHNLGADTAAAVTSSATFTFPSSATWTFRIGYEAYDTNGNVFGSVSYDYASDKVSRGDYASVKVEAASANTAKGLAYGMSYSTPSGWEVYDVDYTYSFSYRLQASGSATASVGASAFSNSISGGGGFNTAGDMGAVITRSFSTSSFSNSAPSVTVSAGKNTATTDAASSEFGFRSASATIYRRKPAPNSTTPSNNYRINSYNFALTSAQVLATGSLNYTAIGE